MFLFQMKSMEKKETDFEKRVKDVADFYRNNVGPLQNIPFPQGFLEKFAEEVLTHLHHTPGQYDEGQRKEEHLFVSLDRINVNSGKNAQKALEALMKGGLIEEFVKNPDRFVKISEVRGPNTYGAYEILNKLEGNIKKSE